VDTKLLVCVDPLHAHDKPGALDHRLLRTAAFLAGPLGNEVHALHVFSIPTPVTVVGDAYIAAAAIPPAEATVAAAAVAFRQLMAVYSLPTSRAHLKVGVPARDILGEARALDVGLVMMGAVSRGRLDRWFVGNTAEAVLDRLACNVWVEKPRAT
jgi:universal stress protein E